MPGEVVGPGSARIAVKLSLLSELTKLNSERGATVKDIFADRTNCTAVPTAKWPLSLNSYRCVTDTTVTDIDGVCDQKKTDDITDTCTRTYSVPAEWTLSLNSDHCVTDTTYSTDNTINPVCDQPKTADTTADNTTDTTTRNSSVTAEWTLQQNHLKSSPEEVIDLSITDIDRVCDQTNTIADGEVTANWSLPLNKLKTSCGVTDTIIDQVSDPTNTKTPDTTRTRTTPVTAEWTLPPCKVVADRKMLADNDQKHSNGTSNGETKQVKCFWPKCQFKSWEPRALKDHYAVHQKTKNQFKCDANNCQKTFKYKQNLIQHKLSHKFSANPLGRKTDFGGKVQLIRHKSGLNSHNSQNSVPNQNSSGGQQSANPSGLVVAHKSNVLSSKMSAENKSLVVANKSVAVKKEVLSSASSAKKIKEKRFLCDFSGCDKCFDSKSNLERHKRIHSGEKPFGCDIPDCGQRFTQKTHLVQHKKRKHRIILPKNAIKLIKPVDSMGRPIETPPATPAAAPDKGQPPNNGQQSLNSPTMAFTPTVVSTPLPAKTSSVVTARADSVSTAVTVAAKTPPALSTTPVSAAKTAIKTPIMTRNANNASKAANNTPAKTASNAAKTTSKTTPKTTPRAAAKSTANNSTKAANNSADTPVSRRAANDCETQLKQYKCYITRCQYSYDSLYELKTHVNSVHPNESINKCNELNCSQVFKSFYNLYYHKKTFHKL